MIFDRHGSLERGSCRNITPWKEVYLEKGLQIKRLYLWFWWNDTMERFFDEMGVLTEIIGIVEKDKTGWLVKKVGDRGLEIKNEL